MKSLFDTELPIYKIMKRWYFLIAGIVVALLWIDGIAIQSISVPKQKEKLDTMSYRQRNLYLLTQYAPYSDYAAYMEDYTYQESHYPSYLYREIEQSELCAIVRVKNSEIYNGRCLQMITAYKELFGNMSDTEGKELTQKEIKRLLAEKPYLIQYASGAWKKTVEVEKYLYDRTGRYEEEFGMGSCSQIITPEGYVVPVNITRDREAGLYSGMKLEDYLELVTGYYEEEEKRLSLV